jgi:uncharacterized membrane protein
LCRRRASDGAHLPEAFVRIPERSDAMKLRLKAIRNMLINAVIVICLLHILFRFVDWLRDTWESWEYIVMALIPLAIVAALLDPKEFAERPWLWIGAKVKRQDRNAAH